MKRSKHFFSPQEIVWNSLKLSIFKSIIFDFSFILQVYLQSRSRSISRHLNYFFTSAALNFIVRNVLLPWQSSDLERFDCCSAWTSWCIHQFWKNSFLGCSSKAASVLQPFQRPLPIFRWTIGHLNLQFLASFLVDWYRYICYVDRKSFCAPAMLSFET